MQWLQRSPIQHLPVLGKLNLPPVSKRFVIFGGLLLFSIIYSVLPHKRSLEPGTVASWLASIAIFLLCSSPPFPQWSLRSQISIHIQHRARVIQFLFSPVVIMAFLLVLAFVLRVVNLEYFPPLFHGDEGEMAVDALAIAQGKPEARYFFGTGWFEHPSLHFYLEAIAIKIFGVSFFAPRFVTVVFGTLGVLVTYLAGRRLVSPRAGLFAAAIAASAPVDIHLSRISLNNVETLVFGALALYFLFGAISTTIKPRTSDHSHIDEIWNSGTALEFGLAGVVGSLSLYFYFASRLVPVLMAVLCLFALLRFRRYLRPLLSGFGIMLVGFLITIMPLLVFYIQNPQITGSGRFNSYFLLSNLAKSQSPVQLGDVLGIVAVSFRESVSQFLYRPDGSQFFAFAAPVLITPVATLAIAGILLTFFRPLRLSNFTLLMWFWLTLIAGNVLMIESPYTPRIVGLLPAVYIFAAVAIEWFLHQMSKLDVPGKNWWPTAAAVAMIVAITFISINNYFNIYFARDPNPTPTAMARFAASLPPDTYVYNLSDGLSIRYGPTRYLAYWAEGEDLRDPPSDVRTITPTKDRIAFIVFPKWQSTLVVIKERFPDGVETVVKSGPEKIVFTTYVVENTRALNTSQRSGT